MRIATFLTAGQILLPDALVAQAAWTGWWCSSEDVGLSTENCACLAADFGIVRTLVNRRQRRGGARFGDGRAARADKAPPGRPGYGDGGRLRWRDLDRCPTDFRSGGSCKRSTPFRVRVLVNLLRGGTSARHVVLVRTDSAERLSVRTAVRERHPGRSAFARGHVWARHADGGLRKRYLAVGVRSAGENGAMTDPLDSSPRPEVIREEVDVRRSPRVWRILGLGAGLGAMAAFVLTVALPETQGFSRAQVFGFSLLLFVTLFGALAGLVVVLLERVVGRRVVRATAVHTVAREAAPAAEEVGAPPETPVSDSPDGAPADTAESPDTFATEDRDAADGR